MSFRAVLTVCALLACGTARAGDKPLYAPAPGWVKAAPPVDAAGLGDGDPIFLVLDRQDRLEQGRTWTYSEVATRIASTQVLAQAGTVKLPWDPDKGDLTIHAAEILRGGERIDLVAGRTPFSVLQREEMLEQGYMSGMLTATLSVEGLRVGDVLRIAFSVTRADAALKGNVQTVAALITRPAPVKYAHVRVLWPSGLGLAFKAHVGADAAQPSEAGGWKEINIAMPLPEPPELPDDVPARFRPLPLVEAASFAGWGDVVATMAPLYATAGTIAPGSPLAGEVAKIAAASADPRMRAALALRLVQDEVRYLFRGMDGGNYVPQAPAQTWELRYGDCKAKSLLLLAILRELGIEGDAALVHSAMGELLPERLPMPGAFDHVIVRARIGGETLWLDGTAGGTRLADLGDAPPFRYALPLRAGAKALDPIPVRPPARPDADVEIEVDASAGLNLPAPFKIRAVFRGRSSEMLRMAVTAAGKERSDEFAEGLLGEYLWGPQFAERAVRYDAESGATVVTAAGIASPQWVKEGGRLRLALDRAVSDIGFAPDRSRPAWKALPVSTGVAGSRRVATRIRLPDGGAGFALDGDQVLPPMLGGLALARTVLLADGWLTVEDRVSGGGGEIAAADIPAERQRVTQAKGRLLKAVAPAAYPPRWRLVAAARSSGAFAPLLALYSRRIVAAPGEAESYSARAWFLEQTFDRAGAEKDLSRAIAIAPSVELLLWRARLRVDLDDDKGALADAIAAQELDPGSAAAGQVVLLTARTGAIGEALAMAAERIDAGGKEAGDFVSILATLLGDSGKAADGVAALDALIARNPGDPEMLNSRCWLKGTRNLQLDTALKDCTKSIELSDATAHVLDSRGLVWFRLGRMEDALADLNAALEQQPEQAASLFLRGVVLRRIGGAENLVSAEADLAAARMLQPRIDGEYAAWGIKP